MPSKLGGIPANPKNLDEMLAWAGKVGQYLRGLRTEEGRIKADELQGEGELLVKKDARGGYAGLDDLGNLNAMGEGVWPRFSVHKNGTNQTSVGTALEIITWSTEVFDSANDFASNRFTPSATGIYLLAASLHFGVVGAGDVCHIAFYENGAEATKKQIVAATTGGLTMDATTLFEADGRTDYFEVFGANATNGTDTVAGGVTFTWFKGCRIA